MLVDYHTHHYRCGHASGNLADYVEAAIAAGLTEIGLSDHSPIYHLGDDPHPRPGTAMHRDEFDRYFKEIEEVRDRYADRIAVRLGVESDYVAGWSDFYERLWARYPLDYVIGSVHWLGDWNIFTERLPAGKSAEDVVAEYFNTTQEAARSGIYQIIGHLDCLKTRGHLHAELSPIIRETIDVLAETDVAIELNTSGWRKSCDDCYPNRELLRYAAEKGVAVTLGSDAHSPDLVSAGFERALSVLRECGFKHLATFKSRTRHLIPLDEVRVPERTSDAS